MTPFEIATGGDPAALAAMREIKLQRLRFRRPPNPDRAYGRPADFLTAELTAEFAIPDAPPVSANEYGGAFIAEIRANPDRICLDVGAGLRASCFANVVNAEIYPGASTDVVCVGEDLPFESDQFDYALCCAVLEHTRRPWDVAREIVRVLKPGGKLLVDYPFLQGVHGYPHHYFNATPGGAVSLFEEHCDILESTIGRNNHPIQALCWILREWRHGLTGPTAEEFGHLTVDELLSQPADAQFEADYARHLDDQAARDIAAGSTLVACKRASPPHSRLEALELEVAALRASRSWRVTQPLRTAGKVWKRVFRSNV